MMAARWETVERFIDVHGLLSDSFTSAEYAASEGVSGAVASIYIQAHLDAQRGPRSRTKYVLKRMAGTRTRNARWSVGERAKDVRGLGLAFSNDVKLKWMRAVEPDIRRIAAINPLAARRAEIIIDATLDGALKVLEAAVKT